MFDVKKYSFTFLLLSFLIMVFCNRSINAMNSYKKNLHKIYNFVCITNEKAMKKLCLELSRSKAFALDTETTGFDPVKCSCIGISVCMQEGEAFYIPFGHKVKGEQLTTEQVVKYFKPIFENEKIKKYLHHALFDMMFLYTIGIDLKGLIFCSLIASHCIDPKSKHGLKSLSEKYFGETMINFKKAVFDNGYKDFSELPLDLANKYAAADAHQTWKICKVFEKKLEEKNLKIFYYEKLLPKIEVDYKNLKKKILSKDSIGTKKYMQDAYNRFHDIQILKSMKKIKSKKNKKIHSKNGYEPKNKKRKLYLNNSNF